MWLEVPWGSIQSSESTWSVVSAAWVMRALGAPPMCVPCPCPGPVAYLRVDVPSVSINGMADREGSQTKPHSLKIVSSDKGKKKSLLGFREDCACRLSVCVYLGSPPKTSSAVLWTEAVALLAYVVTSSQEWARVDICHWMWCWLCGTPHLLPVHGDCAPRGGALRSWVEIRCVSNKHPT